MSEATDVTITPELVAAENAVQALVTMADTYQVVTAEHYTAGGEDLKQVKAAQKRLEELRTGMTAPLNKSLKAINDFFRKPAERLTLAESKIKRALLAYSSEQDRIRREQQAKLDEQARKERDRLAAQAAKAAAAGKVERAEQIEARAAQVVAPIVQADQPKVSGLSTREVWKFEVTDPGRLPREYTLPDEQKIRRVVVAMRGDTMIPGVRVWVEKHIAAGSV